MENVNDLLDDGTEVQMVCWIDGQPPPDGSSPRWFWVIVRDPPHPGEAGYVWSDLVWDQIAVPRCTDALTIPAQPLKNARVTLAQGRAADEGGYFYAVTLSGFPAGWVADVECFDSSDPYNAFHSFLMTVDASGRAVKEDGCRSAEGDQHWVVADWVESNRVAWRPRHPSPGASSPTDPPDGGQEQPAPPRSVTLTVSNRVTDGATRMREDSTPIYLSSRTQPFCVRYGCKLDGTEMGSGARVVAECWTTGERMTNGQDNSTIDDSNPGLVTSSTWYGVRWPDGRRGFIAEIWIENRGTHALPNC
jgi:hypothetical protein